MLSGDLQVSVHRLKSATSACLVLPRSLLWVRAWHWQTQSRAGPELAAESSSLPVASKWAWLGAADTGHVRYHDATPVADSDRLEAVSRPDLTWCTRHSQLHGLQDLRPARCRGTEPWTGLLGLGWQATESVRVGHDHAAPAPRQPAPRRPNQHRPHPPRNSESCDAAARPVDRRACPAHLPSQARAGPSEAGLEPQSGAAPPSESGTEPPSESCGVVGRSWNRCPCGGWNQYPWRGLEAVPLSAVTEWPP